MASRQMTSLAVGRTDYLESAVIANLLDRGDDVWIRDDLSICHRSLLPESPLRGVRFVEARAG